MVLRIEAGSQDESVWKAGDTFSLVLLCLGFEIQRLCGEVQQRQRQDGGRKFRHSHNQCTVTLVRMKCRRTLRKRTKRGSREPSAKGAAWPEEGPRLEGGGEAKRAAAKKG